MNQKLRFLCFQGIHNSFPSFWAKLGYLCIINWPYYRLFTKNPDQNWSASYKCWTVATPYSADAKENLKFEETTEDIVIKNEVNIKEENDIIENNEFDNKEPENDSENEEELDDYNNESLDWYEPEVYEESFEEDPPKKKRGRPPKHKIEGTI